MTESVGDPHTQMFYDMLHKAGTYMVLLSTKLDITRTHSNISY